MVYSHILQNSMVKKENNEVAVLLHDIRSTHNVGSIFRTSDALGVNKIYLSGYTPTPVDKYGRARKDIGKVSLGAEKTLSWEYEEDPKKIIKKLKKDGWQVVCVEQDKKSVDYKKVRVGNKVLFVMGNEVFGVDKKIMKLCDVIAEIPMRGDKESLNVSVAFGVALFRILNA
ncbi:MAG: tRNA/rRNA methyltransferase SpoU [Parcubacteria group bacterium Gr01-1014_46]|nr:MAG: tRNA/rRNA methyltransferase SpoU [Parcubacteria group bacterium Gr01-1014_46]